MTLSHGYTEKAVTMQIQAHSKMELPKSGDVIDGITVKGINITKFEVILAGFAFKTYDLVMNASNECYVPVTINLLRLGLHAAHILLDGNAEAVVRYKLFTDREYRMKLSIKEPGQPMQVEWYSIIDANTLNKTEFELQHVVW